MTSSNNDTTTQQCVDFKPRWEGILPALIEVLTRGEDIQARQFARDELRRMATLADAHVAERKRATHLELKENNQ